MRVVQQGVVSSGGSCELYDCEGSEGFVAER